MRQARACGVWVLNIDIGQTIVRVRFEEAVQEIFAVQILPWPDSQEFEIFRNAPKSCDSGYEKIWNYRNWLLRLRRPLGTKAGGGR